MARTTTGYQSTVTTHVTLDCECENCGKEFSYGTQITGFGQSNVGMLNQNASNLKSKAQTSAYASLEAQLNRLSQGDLTNVDVHPCPHCQAIQSWMVTSAKQKLSNKFTDPLPYVIGIMALITVVLIGNLSGIWKLTGGIFVGYLIFCFIVDFVIKKFWTPKAYHKGQPQKLPSIRMAH